jgi:hypothetical protein
MQTRELQENWLIWLDMSQRLMRTQHELTVAITLRDTERINRLNADSRDMLRRLKDIREDISIETNNVSGSLGTGPSVQEIVASLEKSEAQSVQGLSNRMIVAERTIRYLLTKNKALFDTRFAVVEMPEATFTKAA